MGRLSLFLFALVSGCAQIAGLDDPLPGGQGNFCYGTGLVKVCFDQAPSGDTMISNNINDTTGFGCNDHVTSVTPDPQMFPVCVISGTTIEVPAGNTVAVANPVGSTPTPLVLVATDSVTIAGTLDASGAESVIGTAPAGSDYSGCQAGNSPSGNGGGQGGSSAAKGGNGGQGVQSGGTAGAALPAPTELHGGCPGHDGGGNGGGRGGHGGGGVYIIAGSGMISVTGRVDVSGAGGSGARESSSAAGGGGGGAGGMIDFDAPAVTIAGAVCAVGGGGGAGAWQGTEVTAQSGGDPAGGSTGCTPASPASGNNGGGGGGMGASSGAGTQGGQGQSGGGGGGGGGGAGYIKIYGAKSGSGVIVPPPV